MRPQCPVAFPSQTTPIFLTVHQWTHPTVLSVESNHHTTKLTPEMQRLKKSYSAQLQRPTTVRTFTLQSSNLVRSTVPLDRPATATNNTPTRMTTILQDQQTSHMNAATSLGKVALHRLASVISCTLQLVLRKESRNRRSRMSVYQTYHSTWTSRKSRHRLIKYRQAYQQRIPLKQLQPSPSDVWFPSKWWTHPVPFVRLPFRLTTTWWALARTSKSLTYLQGICYALTKP